MRTTLAAVVLAGLFALGAAYLIGGRYTFRSYSDGVMRFDRFTGDVAMCATAGGNRSCQLYMAATRSGDQRPVQNVRSATAPDLSASSRPQSELSDSDVFGNTN